MFFLDMFSSRLIIYLAPDTMPTEKASLQTDESTRFSTLHCNKALTAGIASSLTAFFNEQNQRQ